MEHHNIIRKFTFTRKIYFSNMYRILPYTYFTDILFTDKEIIIEKKDTGSSKTMQIDNIIQVSQNRGKRISGIIVMIVWIIIMLFIPMSSILLLPLLLISISEIFPKEIIICDNSGQSVKFFIGKKDNHLELSSYIFKDK